MEQEGVTGGRNPAQEATCACIAYTVEDEAELTPVETAFATIKSVIAGGSAGMLAKTVVAPVDRIKILFQVSTEPFSVKKVLKIVRRIRQEEGVTGLWRGNSATMLRVFPYAGIQFMTFDAVKTYLLKLKGHDDKLTKVESLFAGSFAGFVSCTLTYPLDMARAILAVEHMNKGTRTRNVLYIVQQAYREGGVPRLYRGLMPTLLGILPYAGIAFTINDQAKQEIKIVWGHEPTTLQKLGCGAFAGLMAQSATYPLDVVRRRMQTAGVVRVGTIEGNLYGQAEAQGMTRLGVGMLQMLRDVYKTEGYRGLFKGLSFNWIKGPIALSISFTTFDFLKKHFGVDRLA